MENGTTHANVIVSNSIEAQKKLAARVGFETQPELIEEAEKIGITPAKLKAMREYSSLLMKQNPKMKLATVRKNVAEKFKVKIV